VLAGATASANVIASTAVSPLAFRSGGEAEDREATDGTASRRVSVNRELTP